MLANCSDHLRLCEPNTQQCASHMEDLSQVQSHSALTSLPSALRLPSEVLFYLNRNSHAVQPISLSTSKVTHVHLLALLCACKNQRVVSVVPRTKFVAL